MALESRVRPWPVRFLYVRVTEWQIHEESTGSDGRPNAHELFEFYIRVVGTQIIIYYY